MAQLFRGAFRNKWLGQPASAQGVVPAAAGLVLTRSTRIHALALWNRGIAMPMGAIALLKDAAWEAGQWADATTTYTADTADAQSAATNDFALETTTVNDGFIVGADVPFGALSVDVTTAGSGTAPTHVVEFWDGAAWVAIAAAGMLVDIARSADWGAGEALVLFDPPAVWAKGGSGTGVNADRYNLRVRRTNATQATAALARRLYVGVPILTDVAVDADGFTERRADPEMFVSHPNIHAALGLAAGTADEAHLLEVIYTP